MLAVALTALLLMALSAAALLRTVDTTARVTGNLAAAGSAQAAVDLAVEQAVADLFEVPRIGDTAADAVDRGFRAARSPGEDARGAPALLQSLAAYPAEGPVLDVGDGVAVRYVIERMCAAPGPPSADACLLTPAGDMPLAGSGMTEPPWVPVYRQTVRVDGPGPARALAQAWLADVPGRRRIAWRMLAE